ncbi:MAG TPA: sulfite exporter TauE/SafE family protein [Phycisphaerales bacterium]|nr:sulfite exporter TauE/SafE family protein [Phycisphaerales bacterium]
MMYLTVCLTAVLASALTLFSGFGLGTVLLPAFAIFFPTEIAVALTAIVHLLNNLFKFVLVGRHADRRVVMRFGLPALVASFVGAAMLLLLTHRGVLYSYSLGGKQCDITLISVIVAFLMLAFATLELWDLENRFQIKSASLPYGGLLSGFFGGLSGHQGALRAAFLVRSGLDKQAYIATGVVIACMIDVARLLVYSSDVSISLLRANGTLLAVAAGSAFLGAFVGVRLMPKVTLRFVRMLVAVLLALMSVAMGTGLLDRH